MKIIFTKNVGGKAFQIEMEVDSPRDFFEKVAFWDSLPEAGPAGEADLQIIHRNTRDGHSYYEILCPSARQVLQFGQHRKDPSSLYRKGWVDEYGSDRDHSDNGQEARPDPPADGGNDRTQAKPGPAGGPYSKNLVKDGPAPNPKPDPGPPDLASPTHRARVVELWERCVAAGVAPKPTINEWAEDEYGVQTASDLTQRQAINAIGKMADWLNTAAKAAQKGGNK